MPAPPRPACGSDSRTREDCVDNLSPTVKGGFCAETCPLHRSLALACLIPAQPALAQATRTWVSGVGDDANPCSRTAPCKTFAGAISKTAAEGEIDALDPGGYGAVTITKSITIDGQGTLAGVLAAGTNGIIINAGAAGVVTLRNLNINGAGSGMNGIRVLTAAAVHVENCVISGFNGNGIDMVPTTTAVLTVTNSFIFENVGNGVLVKSGVGGFSHANLRNVRLERNGVGLRGEDNALISVRNTDAVGNAGDGFLSVAAAGGLQLHLDEAMSTNNGGAGVRSNGGSSVVSISGITVTGNINGGLVSGGGAIASFGNNRIAANFGGNGAPTSFLTLQ